MGCSQSKAVVQLEKPVQKQTYNDKSELINLKTEAEASNDTDTGMNLSRRSLSSLNLKMGDSLSSAVIHIESINTSSDNPYGKPIEHFYDGIYDGKILGSGISGIVRECTHKKTGHKYAVKCLDLDKIGDEKGLEYLKSEILIMSELDHPSIVRLEEVYESHNEIYLVQELCHGGELFDKLEDQEDYHYSEGECARLVKQMLSSVRYIHSKGIVHRDLKLENFLFSTKDNDSELKLIDFGLSKYFVEGEVISEAVGTPYTIAPETIEGRYNERVDLWAIGVITYLLLSGETPFGGAGGEEPLWEVRNNILSGKYRFEPEYIWEKVSDSAKDFINQLLVLDPEKRMSSAEEAQQHPWVVEWSEKSQSDTLLSPNVMKNLIEFKGYGDMRKLLCEVLSFTLLPDQIQDLKKEFEILDVDGSGEITLESLKKVLIESAHAGSLGALMDEEVEDIFNAMRFKETQTTIRWHEFIAASLSLCRVDDRNLRIAFDRLDSDHKGYISLDNVMNLIGYAEECKKGAIREMYENEISTGGESKEEGITYEDFVLLMKGQTKNGMKESRSTASLQDYFIEPPEPRNPHRINANIAVNLPEHDHSDANLESLLHDEHHSNLEVNRNLYRSHRQMRICVLEATKRFEDMQTRRSVTHGKPKPKVAGLVASHIAESQFTSPWHQVTMKRAEKKQRKARRTKTKSDLAGMGIGPSDEPAPRRRRSSEMNRITEGHDVSW